MPAAHVLKRKIKKSQLVGLLAPTLGQEKSESLVNAAARVLGMQIGEDLRVEQAYEIIERLSIADGIVGVVARFVKTRGELDELADHAPSSKRPGVHGLAMSTPGGGIPIARTGFAEPRLPLEELVHYLAPALGDEKAREAVATYAAQIGALGPDVTRAQADAMLEHMSQADGILGVVASFAKARFLLRYPG